MVTKLLMKVCIIQFMVKYFLQIIVVISVSVNFSGNHLYLFWLNWLLLQHLSLESISLKFWIFSCFFNAPFQLPEVLIMLLNLNFMRLLIHTYSAIICICYQYFCTYLWKIICLFELFTGNVFFLKKVRNKKDFYFWWKSWEK